MYFDPDVVRFFAQMQQSGQPPMEQLPLPAARAKFSALGAQFGFPPLEMAEVRGAQAPGPRGPVPLRLYRPVGVESLPAPTCVYVHGGGGVLGDLDSHDDICRHLAARAGCQVLAVDYRLAPEHPAPAGIEDVIAVVQWLAANSVEVGADPQRLAIAGDSIGGAMAAGAALAARDAGIFLRCQVLVYPLTDARPDNPFPSRVHNAVIPPLTEAAMHFFDSKLFPDPAVTTDWRISPALALDVAGVAPALLVLADRDALYDEGLHYAQRLRQAGVEVTMRVYPGMIHGFISMGAVLRAAGEAIDLAALQLRQRLLPVVAQA